jgi:hypothetical protein
MSTYRLILSTMSTTGMSLGLKFNSSMSVYVVVLASFSRMHAQLVTPKNFCPQCLSNTENVPV